MTWLRTLRTLAALGALPLAACGGDAFSLAMDGGPTSGGPSSGIGSGASSGTARSGSTSGRSSGAPSGSSSGAGSGTSSGSASGASSGAGASGSSSGAPDAGGGLVCPAAAPNPGSTCLQVGFSCEYGTSPNLACNQHAQCGANGWAYPFHTACPLGLCPASYDLTPAGGACNPDGLTCGYLRGTCNCSPPSGPLMVRPDGGAVGSQWQCRLATPGCHSPRPNLGTPCTEEGRSCDYGSCLHEGIVLQCKGGVWQEGPMPPCPL